MIENENVEISAEEEGAVTAAPTPAPKALVVRKKPRYKFWSLRTLFILFALAPALIHLALFWLTVQIQSIGMAFTDWYTLEFTWENFSNVFANLFNTGAGQLGLYLKNTLIFWLLGLCMMPISLFAVYMIYKKMYGHAIIRIVIYLPGAISSLMMVMLFKDLLASSVGEGNDGPVKYLLNSVFNMDIKEDLVYSSKYALSTIIIYDIWMGLGGNMVIWLGAMGRIPPDVIEYGKLDGVGPVREFVSIILPLIWPTFCTMLTLHIIGLFGSSGSVMAFTGKNSTLYGTTTLSYWLYDVVFNPSSASSQNYAVAAGLIFTLITIPLVIVGRWFMNKFGEAVGY